MKKITFIFVVFLLYALTIPNTSNAQTPDWTRLLQMNTFGLQSVNLVTADANNVYLAGKISGPIIFDGFQYTSIGYADLLIVKMTNAGITEWVKQFNAQSNGSITPNAIKVDATGNIFIAVTFSGTISIGGNTLTSSDLYNSFCAKFNNSGNAVWSTPFLSTGTGSSKIDIDGNNNCFLISKTNTLFKFNSVGTILWEQGFPVRTLQSLAVFGSNLYLGGTLQAGTTYFGTIPLTSLGGNNTGFLVKADLNGVYTNSIIVGGSPTSDGSSVSDIVMDNSGNLIITGCYTKNLTLGIISIFNPTESYYTYIAKCDDNFDFAWAKSSSDFLNNNREMWTYRIFIDNSSNIYEFGMISSSFTFGAVTLTLNTGNQFLIKFDANGNAINGYVLQNASYDRTVVNHSGKILVGGNYNYAGSTSYGNFSITQFNNNLIQDWQKISSNNLSGIAKVNYVKHDAAGNTYIQSRVIGYCDYFGTIINTNNYVTVISKHDITGNLLWIKQIADISPQLFGSAFTIDKDNNVLTVGLFQTSLNIGTTILTSTNSGYEGYVAKYSSSGGFLWAAKMNLNANVSVNITVASDNAGNVLVSGVLNPANYLVKFDALGNQLWAKIFPMESYYLSIISTDANNNIYLSSEIHLSDGSGSTTIGSITLTQTYNDGSTALIKFDPNGNALWAKTYGGVIGATYSDGWACDIKTDATGNTFLWGWCSNNAIFGSVILTNPFTTNQNYSYYLAKINTSGDVVWAKAVYETKYAFNYGDLLDLDKNGNVYVGGHFNDRISIEGTEYVPEGTNDFFAVKYSSTGGFHWIKTIPANSTIINAFSIYDDNVLSLAGAAGKNSTLGSFNIIKKGGSNCIIATLGKLPQLVSDIEITSIKIFPNPVINVLFINGLTQKSTISIFDISGKMVYSSQITTNQIDVSKIANGNYLIQIKTDKQTLTKKIVVCR